jgi:MSHA biogenesis protein MshN
MSVINQVLNQIEQRGAQRLPGQNMVRAVPPARDMRKLKIALLVLGVVLAICALAWQRWTTKKPVVAATNNVHVKPVVAIAAPVSVIPISGIPASDTPASGIVGEPVAEALAPKSRLSAELSEVFPSSFQTKKNNSAAEAAASAKSSSKSTKPLLSPHSQPTGRYAAAPTKPVNKSSKSNEPPQSHSGMPVKQISTAQQADAEFHKATGLAQQGGIAAALAGYEAALHLNPGHDAARQALVALLLESKRSADAERVLLDGIKSRPEQAGFAMLLARLQVERGAVDEALITLERSLQFANRQADYQAFLAALLQRQNRHNEAIAHYQIVLQLVPNNGIWLMGYGISLRAAQRNAEAKDAFKRALETQTLSPELREFVQQKLKGL